MPGRLVAAHPDQVRAIDFVSDRTADGRLPKILKVTDEHTPEALATPAARPSAASARVDPLRPHPEFASHSQGRAGWLPWRTLTNARDHTIIFAAIAPRLSEPVQRSAELVPVATQGHRSSGVKHPVDRRGEEAERTPALIAIRHRRRCRSGPGCFRDQEPACGVFRPEDRGA